MGIEGGIERGKRGRKEERENVHEGKGIEGKKRRKRRKRNEKMCMSNEGKGECSADLGKDMYEKTKRLQYTKLLRHRP